MRIGLLFAAVFVFLSAAVSAQTITVTLSGNETGWLNCPEANVSTRCWFKSSTPVTVAGVYSGQVSWMGSKNREGIIIFGGPIDLSQGRGIFIHEGSNPSYSGNCVVITRSEMDKLYNTLKNTYGFNGMVFSIHVAE
jgi:hypothetical protein